MTPGGPRRVLFIALVCMTASGAAFAQPRPPDVPNSPVTWIIFVDDLHLDFRNTGRIRDLVKKIAAELIREADQFAMVSSGPSALAVDVTADREVLASSIRKITGNALKYEDMQTPYGPEEVRYRASIAVMTARSILANVPRLSTGRKAMLYISNGSSFDALPDQPERPRSPSGPPAFTRSQIHEQLGELTTTATQSDVRIFPIDPWAVLGDPLAVIDPGWETHRLATTTFLRSIADKTAGFAILDGDFVTGLRRISDAVR